MKKISVIISIVLVVCISLIACSDAQSQPYQDNTLCESAISALESQIHQLQQEQDAFNAENQKKLSELKDLIGSTNSNPHDSSQPETDATPNDAVGFTYTVSDGYATITGYVGNDTALVIPATIDSYRVIAVADNAFEDLFIKSVIISDGVQKIGWFAFNGCVRLTSVTIPSSVEKIGYSAFGSAGSSLTLYCHSGSFALSYAQSYGLSYTVI